jgi:hypothetical protein
MRKLLLLTLLLSSILKLGSQNFEIVGVVDTWNTTHTLEENISDSDNQDFDETLSKSYLFSVLPRLAKQQFIFNKNRKNIRLTHDFIRAPPTQII